MSEKAQNIKISSRAWELLRWAKFKLNTKSYSDSILEMNKKISSGRSDRLKRALSGFDEQTHRIKFKIPKDKKMEDFESTKPKTILLNPEAHRTLELIKIESNKPAYTFSDAIEFLVKENSLIPEHLA